MKKPIRRVVKKLSGRYAADEVVTPPDAVRPPPTQPPDRTGPSAAQDPPDDQAAPLGPDVQAVFEQPPGNSASGGGGDDVFDRSKSSDGPGEV